MATGRNSACNAGRLRKQIVKFFPSHKSPQSGAISVSVALDQIPAYAVRPWIWGQCITWCACLRLIFCWYPIILLGDRGTLVQQFAQGHYAARSQTHELLIKSPTMHADYTMDNTVQFSSQTATKLQHFEILKL